MLSAFRRESNYARWPNDENGRGFEEIKFSFFTCAVVPNIYVN